MAKKARSLEYSKLLDEKVLQRYVWDKLSTPSKSVRQAFMPKRIHNRSSNVRVVIPEYPVAQPKHSVDFRVIFDDGLTPKYQNVEVEWKTSRFMAHVKNNAHTHYLNGQGYILTLFDDTNKAPRQLSQLVINGSLDVVEISPTDFSDWFVMKSRQTVDGTISHFVPEHHFRDEKRWVVYVSKPPSETDYFRKGKPAGRWAFRFAKNAQEMANIFSITSRDKVIFAARWTLKGGRTIYPEEPWRCQSIDIFDVTTGYYCSFDDNTFEKKSWNGSPEDKEYMHYFEFDKSGGLEGRSLRGDQFKMTNPLDMEICTSLRKSNIWRGAPVELSKDAYDYMLTKLQ
jgi:hypothetical protein